MRPGAQRRRGIRILVAGILALLVASCATTPPARPAPTPLGVLEPGALAYLSVGQPLLGRVLPVLLGPEEWRSLAPYAKEAQEAALALRSGGGFQASVSGAFPTFSARLGLDLSRDWRREGKGYRHRSSGLAVGLPGGGLVLAAAPDGIGGIWDRLGSSRPSPIPQDLDGDGHSLACYLPDPFSGLVADLLGEKLDIPAEGILLAADPSSSGYTLRLSVLMRDEASARLYRPAVRLVWYGLSRSLFGLEGSPGPLTLEVKGRILSLSGMVLGEGTLETALGRLGQALGPGVATH